jgi:outer membrane lipoprotein-sorting protein
MFKPFAAAVLALPVLLVLPMHAQDDLTLDQIVQKHIEAMGGAAKLKAIHTVKTSGTASLMGGQMEAPVTVLMKRPSSMRVEMSMQGQSFVQAFDGATQWSINPFMGSPDPTKASDEDSATAREDSEDFIEGALFDYKGKGYTAELVGKEDLEGSPAYKVKITKKSGNVSYEFLDAKTFLAVKSIGKRKQAGQEMEVESMTGNYKAVSGVMMPFSIQQKAGGQSVFSIAVEKHEVNVPLDDAQFHMPEKPKDKPSDKDKQ